MPKTVIKDSQHEIEAHIKSEQEEPNEEESSPIVQFPVREHDVRKVRSGEQHVDVENSHRYLVKVAFLICVDLGVEEHEAKQTSEDHVRNKHYHDRQTLKHYSEDSLPVLSQAPDKEHQHQESYDLNGQRAPVSWYKNFTHFGTDDDGDQQTQNQSSNRGCVSYFLEVHSQNGEIQKQEVTTNGDDGFLFGCEDGQLRSGIPDSV